MAFKKKTELMNLGGLVTLTDGGGLGTATIALPLSTLDREVFIVTDVQMDADAPFFDLPLGSVMGILGSVNKATSNNRLNINDPDAIATIATGTLQGAGANAGAGAYYESFKPDENSIGSNRDYLSIISTPNWHICGSYATTGGGGPPRSIYVRITGYIAKADADTYAALVTEELNA